MSSTARVHICRGYQRKNYMLRLRVTAALECVRSIKMRFYNLDTAIKMMGRWKTLSWKSQGKELPHPLITRRNKSIFYPKFGVRRLGPN